MMNKNKNNEQKIRYCKICGCELASTNKGNLCASCKNKQKDSLGNFIKGLAGFAVAATIFVKKVLPIFNDKN